MSVTEDKFNRVMDATRLGVERHIILLENDISERILQRIKEAGTWERWPYIQAKSKHGYQTPEYYAYLKRRGLPRAIPGKPVPSTPQSNGRLLTAEKPISAQKLSFIQRLKEFFT